MQKKLKETQKQQRMKTNKVFNERENKLKRIEREKRYQTGSIKVPPPPPRLFGFQFCFQDVAAPTHGTHLAQQLHVFVPDLGVHRFQLLELLLAGLGALLLGLGFF